MREDLFQSIVKMLVELKIENMALRTSHQAAPEMENARQIAKEIDSFLTHGTPDREQEIVTLLERLRKIQIK